MSARDTHQRPVKEQRAAEFRRVSMQRDLQRATANRTMERCLASREVRTPGTFAHDVVSQLSLEGLSIPKE